MTKFPNKYFAWVGGGKCQQWRKLICLTVLNLFIYVNLNANIVSKDSLLFFVEIEELCKFKLGFHNDFYELDSLVQCTLNKEKSKAIKYCFRIKIMFDSINMVYKAYPKLLYLEVEGCNTRYKNLTFLNKAELIKIDVLPQFYCNIKQLFYTIPITFKLE